MSDDKNKGRKLFQNSKKPDKSKWTGTWEPAKPSSLKYTWEVARLIRNDEELWAIYQGLKRDDWIPTKVGMKARQLYKDYCEREKLDPPPKADIGEAVGLIRDLTEGRVADLDGREVYEHLKKWPLIEDDLNWGNKEND